MAECNACLVLVQLFFVLKTLVFAKKYIGATYEMGK